MLLKFFFLFFSTIVPKKASTSIKSYLQSSSLPTCNCDVGDPQKDYYPGFDKDTLGNLAVNYSEFLTSWGLQMEGVKYPDIHYDLNLE